MNTGDVSRSKIREVLQLSIKMSKVGRPTYFIPNEEEFVVSAADIEGAHGFPMDTATIAA